jgi:hypothetical protein
MSRFHRLLSVLTLALLLPPLAIANDEQEIQNYVLTDAGLAKYSRAARQLAVMDAEQTGACEESEDGDDAQTISDVVAKMDRHPAAKNAITSAGMNTREYVVFSFALLQTGLAAWAVDQPGGKLPPGTSKANLEFFRNHQAELQQLEGLNRGDDCDDDRQDDEDDE